MCLQFVFLLTMRLSRREETWKTAENNACVTAGQTAIVRWILPLRMPLTGRTLTGFDSNYVFDLGGAKRARTADLLHAMNHRHVHGRHHTLRQLGEH
jgi:hypothetical protein